MTIAASREEKHQEGREATPIFATASRENARSANWPPSDPLSNHDRVANSISFAPRNILRNSLVGLATATSIFAGAIGAPARAQDETYISALRTANEFRGDTWDRSEIERLEESNSEEQGAPANAAALAADDLKSWLSLSDSEVAKMCGFSRRSLVNWRLGTAEPQGKFSRRLFATHALVGNLYEVLGRSKAGLWLAIDDGTGLSRLEALGGGDDGLRRVLTQAERILFPAMPRYIDLDSGMTDAEASRIVISARADTTQEGEVPIRRVRKV